MEGGGRAAGEGCVLRAKGSGCEDCWEREGAADVADWDLNSSTCSESEEDPFGSVV